jgi:hypothetical protein
MHILREVFPPGNAEGVDALLQEGADAYSVEHGASLPSLPRRWPLHYHAHFELIVAP